MRYAVLGLAVLAACSGGDPSHGDAGAPSPASIAIAPANQTLVIDGATPATSTFQVIGTFADGHTADLTSQASFQLADVTLGTFTGPQFTSTTDHGGATSVIAHVGSLVGTTGLDLVLKERLVSQGAPNGAADAFSGPDDPAHAPTIVYPNDGVMVPPNLGRLEIHFLPGAGNSLFALQLSNAVTDVTVYLGCPLSMGSGCIYQPDPQVWHWLAETNRGGQPVTITLRGTGGSGQPVGTSKPITLQVSADEIQGGLYYWTTSNGTAIMRFDFASTATQAERFIGPELSGGRCIGCHALSRDGHKLVAEANGQNDGRLLLLDVASKMPLVPFASTPKSIFESWAPSGDRYVGVYGDQGATDYDLQIFDGSTGALVASLQGTGTAAHPADHPDWSPDGRSIAFTRVGHANTLQRFGGGAIEMVTGGPATFGAPVEIVPQAPGHNRYYPAFSPDSQFLVFDESTCDPNGNGDECDADSDPTATLFAVPAHAGATPIPLTRANAPGAMDGGQAALTSSFPKWSPFVFRGSGESGSRLMWLTFSSTRHFGLRPQPPPGIDGSEIQTGTLIWMVAIDPDRVAAGQDPSYPAFVLPFQDYTTSNHIAQWTMQVVPPIP